MEMVQSLYVGLSAQLALQRRLETLAGNIANQNTAGFRAEAVTFDNVLSKTAKDSVAFVSAGRNFTSQRPGEVAQTGNPLDIAISGEAWFAVSTQAGPALTRDGRLQMTPSGSLQTITGRPVLDVGGSPIQLDPAADPPAIAHDGTITQNGKSVGAVGLFIMDPNAKLTRLEGAIVLPDRPPVPSIDANASGIMQGYIERSNVDPVKEMTRLIEVQRTFEAITASINQIEGSLNESIRVLGGS